VFIFGEFITCQLLTTLLMEVLTYTSAHDTPETISGRLSPTAESVLTLKKFVPKCEE